MFVPIVPCRLVDTRPSAPLNPGQIATYPVRGTNGGCTIPAGATAISGNATITDPTDDGFMTIAPAGGVPEASNLNWLRGQSPTPNAFTVALSAGGAIDVYNDRGNVNVIIDVNGYYEDHQHDDRYYTRAQTDAAVAASNESLVVVNNQASTGALTPQLTLPSSGGVAVATSRTAPLEVRLTVKGGLTCTTSVAYLGWIELDGQRLDSSVTSFTEYDAALPAFTNVAFVTTTLVGLTADAVPAGPHTVHARFACSSGTSAGTATSAAYQLIVRHLSTSPTGALSVEATSESIEPSATEACVTDDVGAVTCVRE